MRCNDGVLSRPAIGEFGERVAERDKEERGRATVPLFVGCKFISFLLFGILIVGCSFSVC